MDTDIDNSFRAAVEDDVVAIPTRDRVVDVGETIYAIGRPDQLRKLESGGAETVVSIDAAQ